jgi:hypothetical protein
MIVTIGILIACVFVSVGTANKTGMPNEMPPPMPPPAPHQPPHQGKAPNARFTQLEHLSMCECIIRHLPIGQDKWELVAEEHNTKWPTKNRTVDQLRWQFAKLHKKKIPTGDPNCPPKVKAVKQCKYLICKRANLGEGNSDVSDIDDNINADDDDNADDHDLKADAEDP